jgi:hypothetical protein
VTVTLTRHAAERVAEFGIGLDIVEDIASRPDVSHTNTAGERVCVSDRHPQWTVVVGDASTVITVLRRLRERWEHDTQPPLNASPATSTAGEARPDATPPTRSVRRRPAPVRQVPADVVSVQIDPAVMAHALKLAGGDPRRLVLNADGSVTTLNRARGSRTGVEK